MGKWIFYDVYYGNFKVFLKVDFFFSFFYIDGMLWEICCICVIKKWNIKKWLLLVWLYCRKKENMDILMYLGINII